jgi:hypothetical protein
MSNSIAGDAPYRPEHDPQMVRYWMRQGPKTAAFLLVIPGCATIGVGVGLLLHKALPWGVIGAGAGLLVWGLVVALTP